MYKGKVKSSSPVYNRCEARNKRLLCRYPDRSWCHLHTSVKLSPWIHGLQPRKLYTHVTQPVPSFTSVVGQAENFSPCPYAAADAHGVMGCDQRKLHRTRSVAVTSAPVQFSIQRLLVPSFTYSSLETFQITFVCAQKQNFKMTESPKGCPAFDGRINSSERTPKWPVSI